jgi:hypothetical protein
MVPAGKSEEPVQDRAMKLWRAAADGPSRENHPGSVTLSGVLLTGKLTFHKNCGQFTDLCYSRTST